MKSKKIYICSNCGFKSPKWLGKCSSCGAWDSFSEEIVTESKSRFKLKEIAVSKAISLDEINPGENYRLSSGIKELDRVLGEGIIPGSVILVGGDPGIGKSTLMLQLCRNKELKPLYISGEESLQQIKYRSARLDSIPGSLHLLAETNIEEIAAAIKSSDCNVVIIDSIQSVFSDRVESTPGSIIQVRECASLLMQIAKQASIAIFLIGHVTKEGFIAGPKVLEHLVDTVLQFEGDKTYSYRILRTIKNRYGSTNEIGIFEMTEKGLQEVANPSELFLVHRDMEDSGIAIVAAIEGSRPILLEIQALVSPTNYGLPQRTSNGIDNRRLQMILAVLEKRLGIQFQKYDVFINVAGGIYIDDPSADLGIAAALVSSLRDVPLEKGIVLVGEIGLTGEVRQVSYIEQRLNESQKLGFKKIMLPSLNSKKLPDSYQIKIIPAERISLAFSKLF